MAKYGFLALPSAIIAFAGDLRNKEDLEKIFSRTQFDVVIHFAGLKAVWESVANPRRYFDNNLIGTINHNEVMAKYDCKKECNLMPNIQKVAVGRLPELNVYGHDYPTTDGGAVRDYIHVMDLADGHIAALRKLLTKEDMGDHSSLHTNLYVNEFSVTC